MASTVQLRPLLGLLRLRFCVQFRAKILSRVCSQAEDLLPRVHQAGRDPSLPPHQQLEAAAVEVLCCTYSRDWKLLQQLLPHALRLSAASLDPRSAAAVRECGARLLIELHGRPDLQQRQQQQNDQQEPQGQHQPWTDIHAHLMAAFRHHQEIGDAR